MRRQTLAAFAMTLASGIACFGLDGRAAAQSVRDLQQMSIAQLEDLDVTSVTRTSEDLAQTPAAVYVITHDEIVRSGAATIPEILRLAPNIQVDRTSSGAYVVTARGFSGNVPDQSFSDQLLVMIDGRSVYSPLYSGVYWDMQDVVPDDIERIEVISGPGATMWGANAVNGVIDIITKKAADTQGGLFSLSAGNLEQSATLQYGGMIGDDLAYRAYLRDYLGDDTKSLTKPSAHDHWTKPQAGARLDWSPTSRDNVTVQGDVYQGREAQPSAPTEAINGRNIEARWTHVWDDGSQLQVQTYYDHMSRSTPGAGNFWVDMYDLDVQHTFMPDGSNTVTWGGGGRVSNYHVNGSSSLYFAPPARSLGLFNGFVQDSIELTPSLTAIAAVKLEADPYSSLTPLPTFRLSWKADRHTLLWAAASRAVRSPTPFDTDVQERVGTAIALDGNPDFEAVKLDAYEAGARMHWDERMTAQISAFYNVYTDVRSVELVPGPAQLNLTWGNGLRGHTTGFEVWGSYQVASWWRLNAAFDQLAEHFTFAPGSSGILGPSQIGDDPSQTASLRSHFQLDPDVGFDADLRYVGRLPAPVVPAYVELNASIGWKVSDTLRLSLAGFDLLHAHHLEFPATEADAVPRSFAVGLQWHF